MPSRNPRLGKGRRSLQRQAGGRGRSLEGDQAVAVGAMFARRCAGRFSVCCSHRMRKPMGDRVLLRGQQAQAQRKPGQQPLQARQ